MKHLHLMYRGWLAVGGWLLAGSAAAQGILSVAAPHFHVDTRQGLVLLNAPLTELRVADDSVRGLSLNGQVFTLVRAVAALRPAGSYRATAQGRPYQVFCTRLPVLELTTHHQIVDEPSVYARLRLSDSTGVTQETATGIEWRGGSSQSYPKKSYELSLWADTLGTTDQDLSLLGMRTDNKWNLQALYNDQLRMRLKVTNELWMEMNQLYYQAQEPTAKSGIGMAYTEVLLNGSYQGIYALTERFDRKQLQLKKYASGTIKGELYKGVDWGGPDTYYSIQPFDNTSLLWGGFEYHEPSEVTDWTNLYNFVDFVVNSPSTTFYSQYASRLNKANAVDYFLFWNLLRATDNGGKNLYVAKYKAGEPYFFVPWDLDGVLGNDWTGSNVNVTTGLLSNGLYDRLQGEGTPGGFWQTAAARWASLRTSVITPAHIAAKLNADHDLLQGNNVYAREHLAWNSYEYSTAQLNYATTWTADRIAYMDGVFGYNPLATTGTTAAADVQVYPNPASGTVYVSSPAAHGQLLVTSLSGQQVLRVGLAAGNTTVDISHLAPGLYLAQVTSDAATVVRKLVVQ